MLISSTSFVAGKINMRKRNRYFPQRDSAAFLAISDRFLADMPAARALPPMRPSSAAAAFLPRRRPMGMDKVKAE
jgi:hypothetical protein